MYNIQNDITQLLSKTFFVNPDSISTGTKFVKHLGLSDSEFIELIVMVEEKHNITFADEELIHLHSVGDLAHLLSHVKRENYGISKK
jgi:acyl carrier protein